MFAVCKGISVTPDYIHGDDNGEIICTRSSILGAYEYIENFFNEDEQENLSIVPIRTTETKGGEA